VLNALILLPTVVTAFDTGDEIADKLRFDVPPVKFTDGVMFDNDRFPVNPPTDVVAASDTAPVAPEIAPSTAPVAPATDSCIPLS
jgi:hypothetical protein